MIRAHTHDLNILISVGFGVLWVSMISDHKWSKETENINYKVSQLTMSELITKNTIPGGNKSIKKSTSSTLFQSSPSPVENNYSSNICNSKVPSPS